MSSGCRQNHYLPRGISKGVFTTIIGIARILLLRIHLSTAHSVNKGQERNYDIKLSKRLSYLLRHGAVRESLNINPDGFISIDDILPKIKPCTFEDIKRVVDLDPKRRYSLRTNAGIIEIRANQGHTINKITELNLKPVLKPDFEIVHGTYFSNWNKICIDGLSRMKRNHIHFAKGVNFLCGLRANAQIFIFIDFDKAISNGISFFESENNVILSPGDSSGFIKPQYFLRVTNKKGEILYSG